jgi:hypothetical protein
MDYTYCRFTSCRNKPMMGSMFCEDHQRVHPDSESYKREQPVTPGQPKYRGVPIQHQETISTPTKEVPVAPSVAATPERPTFSGQELGDIRDLVKALAGWMGTSADAAKVCDLAEAIVLEMRRRDYRTAFEKQRAKDLETIASAPNGAVVPVSDAWGTERLGMWRCKACGELQGLEHKKCVICGDERSG